MDKKMRVVVYCRLARDDGMAMEHQKNYLRDWAAKNECTVVGEITEVGSGTRLDRPGLSEIMRSIQKKSVDALVVRTLDRLARHPLEGHQFIEKLQENGVDLICADEQFPVGLPPITRFLR